MTGRMNQTAELSNPARREVLKSVAWAASWCATGGTLQFGCADAVPSGNSVPREDMTALSARDVVTHIRNGEMKAEDYVAHLLDRHRAYEDLNAVISIDEARVLEQARAIDLARSSGGQLGPLAGLPFVIKDQIDVARYPTTMGHTLLKQYVPERNATVVDAMAKAGGIAFAKTNCGPMIGGFPGRPLSASKNNNPYFGPVRNPYDVTRISGGSSGGNAAAIAAGLAPAGLGEDTGGSIRIPSAFCGIAGLRPSTFSIENAIAGTKRKRYSDDGVWPPTGFLETIGPMARTVADVAFLDTALTTETVPRMNLRATRIGIPSAGYWDATTPEPELQKALLAVFSKLRDAGVELIEIDLNSIVKLAAETPLPRGSADNAFADWLAENVPGVTLEDINRLPRLATYPTPPGAGHSPAPEFSPAARKEALERTARDYVDVFQSNNLVALAFPSQVMVAPLINIHEDMVGQKILVNGEWVDEFELILSNTLWGATLGAPSLNIPVGLVSGLPVGLLLQGAPGDDPRILGLGVAIENVIGPLPPPPEREVA